MNTHLLSSPVVRLLGLTLVASTVVASCRSKSERRKPKTDEAASAVAARMDAAAGAARSTVTQGVEHAAGKQAEAAKRRGVMGFEWDTFRPPRAPAARGTLDVTDEGLVVTFDGFETSIPRPLRFEECPAPDDDAPTEERAVWVVLKEGDRAAALRFGVSGLSLVAHDRERDCVRRADLNKAVLGVESDDPAFDVGSYDTDDRVVRAAFDDQNPQTSGRSVTGDLLSSRPGEESLAVDGSTARLSQGDETLLRVDFGPGNLRTWTASLAGRSDDFLRFVIEGDRPVESDTTVSHRRMLVWNAAVDAPPELMVDVQHTWGGDREGNEEEKAKVVRRWKVGDGVLVAEGEQEVVEVAMMLGVGRCPQMEGIGELSMLETRIDWRFETSDGSKRRLGRARRLERAAPACEDEIVEEVRKRTPLWRSVTAPTVDVAIAASPADELGDSSP